jgi:hypothetical protein
MIEVYLGELSAALGAVGIRGRLRRRILLETEDHLRSDPDGLVEFGEAELVAARFADELATARSRAAANTTFLALSAAGIGYAVALILANRATDIFAGRLLVVALPAAALVVLAPQLAFVSGTLALLRSFRWRSAVVVPACEIRVLRRQTATALSAGWVTIAALAAYALTKGGPNPSWWVPTVVATCGIVVLPLAWATVRFVTAAPLHPQARGESGDAFDDLAVVVGTVPLRRHPWAFCFAVAGLAAGATFAAGTLGGQPSEALTNAVSEALWVCGGFWLFGRSLGLRTSR